MNKAAQSFRDLIVWQRAHEFVLRIYELTKHFPRAEQYCLIPQIRRAAISIPANIAEGFKKRGIHDKDRFFDPSQGSLEEYRYYLILGDDLGYWKGLRAGQTISQNHRRCVSWFISSAISISRYIAAPAPR